MGGMLEVCVIGGKETPNGFQWKINCGQKALVSIKSLCIIKVLAVGNRYKLHWSRCPGAPCLRGWDFLSVVWGGQTHGPKVSGKDRV